MMNPEFIRAREMFMKRQSCPVEVLPSHSQPLVVQPVVASSTSTCSNSLSPEQQKMFDELGAKIVVSRTKIAEEQKVVEIFEKQMEEGASMTYEIIKAELDKEKERILYSLRLAYRSDAFRNFKKGLCSHEDFEVELLRLLKEGQWVR